MEEHPDPALGTESDALGSRAIAIVLDSLLYWAVVIAGALFAAALESIHQSLAMLGWLALLGFTVYFWFLLEGIYGRRPGKAAMGLVVVKEDGSQCTVGASVARNLGWIVDQMGFFPFFFVAMIAFVTDRNQRVGDMIASTVVVETAASTGEQATSDPRDVGQSDASRSRGVR